MLHSFNFLFVIPITIHLIIPLVEWMHLLPLHTGIIYRSRSSDIVIANNTEVDFIELLY